MSPPSEFNEKGVVWALVCSIGDVSADVRVSAQSALIALGAKQPTPVLRALLHTCTQHPSPAAGVLATLMSISEKVMTDCLLSSDIRRSSSDGCDSVFESMHREYKTPLESQILTDWLQEATHQLTRASTSITVKVAADALLVIIASKHNCFSEVCESLLAKLESSDVNSTAWQSAAETLSNVCASRASHAVPQLPHLMRVMQRGVTKANTDAVKTVVASTVAKFAQIVAEAVAEQRSPEPMRKEEEESEGDKESERESEGDHCLSPDINDESEPLSEAMTAEVGGDPDDKWQPEEDLELLTTEGVGELTLEQELRQAQNRELGVLVLPDSPPSSEPPMHPSSEAHSASTPEDGEMVDLPQDGDDSSHHDSVSLSSYTKDCDSIAQLLVTNWLKSSNADLRNETISAIGHLCALLSREKLESLSPAIIATVLMFYRKISLPYNLTCTLAQLIAVLNKQEATEVMRPQLDSMLNAILGQASIAPCYSEPNSVSNYSEALRCAHLITLAYPAQMGNQLLSRLENVSHVQRVAALVVTKHLISCRVLSDDVIAGTIRLLSPILSDSNTRVIRAVAQLILQLCDHHHLDQTSAPSLIAYLVRHGAGAGGTLLNGGSSIGAMEEETVGETCSRALYLLTTTVPSSHTLLWPRLLLFVTSLEFESSLPTVLTCLSHLVVMHQHSPEQLPLVPLLPSLHQALTCHQLLARLIGLCADPGGSFSLGGASLAIISGVGGHISPHLRTSQWHEQVQQLRRTCISLSSTELDSCALQIWQDTLREFLSLTLSAIKDKDFTSGLVTAMVGEISTDTDTERRMFVLSCLGVSLKHCSDAKLISETLNTALRLTNHKNTAEQMSLAICVGNAGAGHIELVLGLLATWIRDADPKKMMSFMAILKADSGDTSACVKGSVVMCLGQICCLTPKQQLLKHVDGPIMLHLLNVINTNKHPGVAIALIETISSVCRALSNVPSDETPSTKTLLPQRPLLLTHLVNSCEEATGQELPQLLSALKDLLMLEPTLEVEERTILLQAALNATHSLLTGPPPATQPPLSPTRSLRRGSSIARSSLHSSAFKSLSSAGSALNTPRHSITSLSSLQSFSVLKSKPESKELKSAAPVVASNAPPVEADSLTGDTGKSFAQLNLLLRTVIQRDPTPAPLDDITTLLQAWLQHSHTTVRSAAITLLLHTLHTYHTHLEFPPKVAVNFHQTSQLVGALVPRLGDSCGGVRVGAVGSIVAVLRIAARYNGHQPMQIEEALQPLTDVQKAISGSAGAELESLLVQVADVLCRELSGVQLRGLVFATAGGLQDHQEGGGLSVAVVMAAVLRQRGHTLHYCCKQLLDHVYGRLERVTDPHTRSTVVRGLTHLATPHLPLLADTLMAYPIPPHRGICETWQAIGSSPKLVCAALTHLQQVVERTHAYCLQQTPAGYSVKVAAIQPLAALLSLTQLLTPLQHLPLQEKTSGEESKELQETPSSESRQAVLHLIPNLLAVLIPRYGSYVGVLPPLHHTPGTPMENRTIMSSFVPNPGATNIVPARAVIECLGMTWGVLDCTGLRECLLQESKDLTHIHTLDTLTHTCSNMASLAIACAPHQIPPLVMALSSPHAERGERAAITALYSQLVYEGCGGESEVLSTVTSMLLALVQDVCPDVRRLALRGLAHYAHLHNKQVDDRLHEIVGALVGGTDQREESMPSIDAEETDNFDHPPIHTSSGSHSVHHSEVVPLGAEERVSVEALRGLAALLPQLPPETVLPHTPLLMIRVRLFAEKSVGEVREASFGVLRGLSSVVGQTQEFQENIPQHLLAAIIHLADKHQPTVVMCKSALLSLAQHLHSDSLKTLMQAKLSPSAKLDYKPFLAELAPLLVNWLADQLSLVMAAACSYYHSRQSELRAAAAYFTGEVVRYGGGEGATGVATGLVLLMRDEVAAVRTAAAVSAPLLSQHAHVL